MAEGGPRPNSGRKQAYHYFINGEKYETLTDAAETNGVSKVTIHNWCKNKKKTTCWKESVKPGKTPPEPPPTKRDKTIPEDIKDAANEDGLMPLDYMLKIMRDETEDKDTRIRMAYYAAPYCHSKGVEKKGKKQEQEEKVGAASKGKFKSGPAPLTRVK